MLLRYEINQLPPDDPELTTGGLTFSYTVRDGDELLHSGVGSRSDMVTVFVGFIKQHRGTKIGLQVGEGKVHSLDQKLIEQLQKGEIGLTQVLME